MAEPRPKSGSFQIHVSYSFDRLLEPKLAQAYDVLVPCRERPVQQREENTIASQTASLIEFAKSHDLEVPAEWVFEDEGYSGAMLERPGLERVRISPPKGKFRLCWRTRQTD
jgi:hypothetical protein